MNIYQVFLNNLKGEINQLQSDNPTVITPENNKPVKPLQTAEYGFARFVMLILPNSNSDKGLISTDEGCKRTKNLPAPNHPRSHTQYGPQNGTKNNCGLRQFAPRHCQRDGNDCRTKNNASESFCQVVPIAAAEGDILDIEQLVHGLVSSVYRRD